MTRSWARRWIWWSSASRRLGSSSRSLLDEEVLHVGVAAPRVDALRACSSSRPGWRRFRARRRRIAGARGSSCPSTGPGRPRAPSAAPWCGCPPRSGSWRSPRPRSSTRSRRHSRRRRTRSGSRPRRGASWPAPGRTDRAGWRSAYSNAEGMMLPVGFECPRVSAWLIAFLSKAQRGGQAHAPVVPRRLRIPLSGPKLSHWVPEMTVGTSLSPGVRFDLLAERAPERVRDVHLAALEHGQPRQVLGDDPPHHALHRGGLAPVAVVRVEDQLDAGVVRRELVGAAPTGAFLKPSSPTFSTYFLGTIQPAPLAGVA